MRKLVAVIAFLAVAALPATALAWPHWYRGRGGGGHRVPGADQGERHRLVLHPEAGAEWARSRRIDVRFVKRCPSDYHCVKVSQGRSSSSMAAWTTLNYDPETNIAWNGSLPLNTRHLTSAAARRKTACHELGRVFGLEHRRTGRTCMRDGFHTMYGHPDGLDHTHLRHIYARASKDGGSLPLT